MGHRMCEICMEKTLNTLVCVCRVPVRNVCAKIDFGYMHGQVKLHKSFQGFCTVLYNSEMSYSAAISKIGANNCTITCLLGLENQTLGV